MNEEVDKNGWEGLMMRANTIYEGKRTNNLLKVKQMQDAEFVITGIELGTKPMLTGEGVMRDFECMASIIIDLGDGNKVNVGSGWSDFDRIHYKNLPNELVGKTATIQFFERTEDKHGKPSLRFPIFKGLRENGE